MKKATGVWILGLVVTLILWVVACKPPPLSREKVPGGAVSYLQLTVQSTSTTPGTGPTLSASPTAGPSSAVSLTLTTSASATADALLEASQTITHTVQAGETLGLLAKKYGMSVATLAALNRIENPDFIRVGQILSVSVPAGWIPLATALPTREPTAAISPAATAMPGAG